MREIKFRAWNGNNMVDLYKATPLALVEGFNIDGLFIPFHSDYKLMQFIGIKDKNGVEYCQEDIVKYKDKNYRLIKGSYMFELVGFYESSQDNPFDFFSEGAYLNAEIIGNIYENPNLL